MRRTEKQPNNRKASPGFTLIETLVALAIFAIMALIVAALFTTAMKQLSRTHEADTALDGQIADAENKNITGGSVTLHYNFGGTAITVSGEKGDAGTAEDEQRLRIITIP